MGTRGVRVHLYSAGVGIGHFDLSAYIAYLHRTIIAPGEFTSRCDDT
jgi:hypothetical protein